MKKTFTKKNKAKQRQGPTPARALAAMLKTVNESDTGMLREEIAEKIIWEDPSIAKYFFVASTPFGVMADQQTIMSIKKGMSLRKKRAILLSSLVDVSHLVAPTLQKVTSMKKKLQKNGAKIMSNNSIGIISIEKADIETVSRKIYNILRWNYGQIPEWDNCLERLKRDLPNNALVMKISRHGETAMNKETLKHLVGELKSFNGSY